MYLSRLHNIIGTDAGNTSARRVGHGRTGLSEHALMQSPSQFRGSSPPFHFHFPGICPLSQFIISHFFHMTSLCTPHQFLFRTFLELVARLRKVVHVSISLLVQIYIFNINSAFLCSTLLQF